MPASRGRRSVVVDDASSFDGSVDESDASDSDAERSASASRTQTRTKRTPRHILNKTHIQLKDDYYLDDLEQFERCEFTMYLMREQHKWNIRKFLRAMVSEKNSRGAYTKDKRVARLASAIFDDPEIASALIKKMNYDSPFARLFSDAMNIEMTLEFERVGETPGMGAFKSTTEPQTLKLEELDKRVVQAMPAFHSFISPLMSSSTQREKIETPFLALVSIIARCRHRQLNNNFPTMLGIYLHSLGLKRRALSVLNGLGLIPSYRTIMRYQHEIVQHLASVLPKLAQHYRRRFLICWDNFDYRDDVHHVTAVNKGNHVCSTTGLFLLGMFIPEEGISIKEFKPHAPLSRHHIHDSAAVFTDSVELDLQRYFIFEALRTLYEKEVDGVFNENESSRSKRPQIPTLERLPAEKTVRRELGPIKFNEGTMAGTFDVADDIMLNKLKLDENDAVFKECIQLTFGDQKTVSLVQSMKTLREQTQSPYGSFKFLLPIPGLFHYRMNFMDLIESLFRGQKGGEKSVTSIYHNMHYMGIARGDSIAFHQKEEAVLRCFNARVIAMMYEKICHCCEISDDAAIRKYLKERSPDELVNLVDSIRSSLFNKEVLRRLEKDRSDEVFNNVAQFSDMVVVYLTLKMAIRHADIELIARCFARTAFFLVGTRKKKYAMLALYMTWLTHTDAASKRLRKAILANGLVNYRGVADSWFEIDRANELLNLKLKTVMKFRRSSTEDPNDLFVRTATISEYLSNLRLPLEVLAGERTDPTHKEKKAREDIRRLSHHLWDEKTTARHPKRSCALKPPYPADNGFSHLESSIERFNELYCKELVDPMADIPEDSAMLDVEEDSSSRLTEEDAVFERDDIVDAEDREGLSQFLPIDDDDDGAFVADSMELD